MIIANFLNSSEVTTDRLFQWDIGQKIQILNIGASTTPTVHFCNKKSTNALVVESSGDDTYNIPNTLLAEEYDITAFIYIGDDTEAKTIKVIHIPVTKRTKPTTYIYTTDEDVIDFMAISAEIHSLLDGLVVTPYDNTKAYKKPNIVYYMGQTYICKSNAEITGVLPTDDTKWGIMCKNGANISTITFSNDTLHFKLETDDIIDVPLNSLISTTLSDDVDVMVGLNIREDENGVLKIGDVIIPQKINLWNGSLTPMYTGDGVTYDAPLDLSAYNLKENDIVEITLQWTKGNFLYNQVYKLKLTATDNFITMFFQGHNGGNGISYTCYGKLSVSKANFYFENYIIQTDSTSTGSTTSLLLYSENNNYASFPRILNIDKIIE